MAKIVHCRSSVEQRRCI